MPAAVGNAIVSCDKARARDSSAASSAIGAHLQHVHVAGPHAALEREILAGLTPIEPRLDRHRTGRDRPERGREREILGGIVARVHPQEGDEVAEAGDECVGWRSLSSAGGIDCKMHRPAQGSRIADRRKSMRKLARYDRAMAADCIVVVYSTSLRFRPALVSYASCVAQFAASADSELAAALLQGVITAALAALCWFLYRRYRKPYLAWWSGAWAAVPAAAGRHRQLSAHRRSRLALLASGRHRLDRACAARRGARLLPRVSLALALPAGRALSAALVVRRHLSHRRLRLGRGTGGRVPQPGHPLDRLGVFSYHRRVGSSGAALLAAAFALWGLHHLDYPFLRARGAWTPWGYYLDILFALAVGAGILLLVLDDLRRGLGALAALSADLQQPRDATARCSTRCWSGRSPFLPSPAARSTCSRTAAAASCGAPASARAGRRPSRRGRPPRSWRRRSPPGVLASRRTGRGPIPACPHPYAAVLPVLSGAAVTGALVIVGEARDPFAALDEDFLVALGTAGGRRAGERRALRAAGGAHPGSRAALGAHGRAARGRAPPALPRAA